MSISDISVCVTRFYGQTADDWQAMNRIYVFLLLSFDSPQFGDVLIRPVAVYGDMAQRFIHCGIFSIGKGHFSCSTVRQYNVSLRHSG